MLEGDQFSQQVDGEQSKHISRNNATLAFCQSFGISCALSVLNAH